jgi:hypothetical protein
MTDGSDQRDFVRALHESAAIADRIHEAIADAPPKLMTLALCDLLQEHLTRLVELDAHAGETQGVRTPRQFWSKQT